MKNYTHISLEERETLYELHISGVLQKDIALALGRNN
jgi:IS30 family transposase